MQINGIKSNSRNRVAIENIEPTVDCGRFPVKAVSGDEITITADLFADGHDKISAMVSLQSPSGRRSDILMNSKDNDHWDARITVNELGLYHFHINGWMDELLTWYYHFYKRLNAGQTIHNDLVYLTGYIKDAIKKSNSEDQAIFIDTLNYIKDEKVETLTEKITLAFVDLLKKYWQPRFITKSIVYKINVERKKAEFSTWYELFPRSKHHITSKGQLIDLIEYLPFIKNLGFDVLYLPPIHPIGMTGRKGKNNAETAEEGEPGSPWAIGSEAGGHCAIEPSLGTMEDFKSLVNHAKKLGIEIALDFALQSSHDHPYINDHPEWFKFRPDGTLQYAENPPKEYKDVYPFDFMTEAWESLWVEIKNILIFWIKQGVLIFRVDNPHTKPFEFWEWLLAEIKKDYPEVIFLSEAFTRPKVMYRLAKLGFSQSYTYFIWKTSKEELIHYFTELTSFPVKKFFRPNLWPNTPDILHEILQRHGRPAFIQRLILAATLGSNYGIYGPLYEFCINTAVKPGSEEYLDSEKYEIKTWITPESNLYDLIKKLNQIRYAHPALQQMATLFFHFSSNPMIICYSKRCVKANDSIIVVVNLDPDNVQIGSVSIAVNELGIYDAEYQVHDLLSDAHYRWRAQDNYVSLDPKVLSAHIFHVK